MMFRVVVLLAALCVAPALARADDSRGVIHKVGDRGETYEDLAEFYYGKRYLAAHLRLFNRRPEPLARGTTIIIPTYSVMPVKNRQSLQQFADANLADARRAEYLAELHGLKDRDRTAPKPGTKLRVVQSLKHAVRPGESLASIARIYYRDASPHRLALLRAYNQIDDKPLKPGASVRIPLDSSEFNYTTVRDRARRTFERPSAQPEVAAVEPTPAVEPTVKVNHPPSKKARPPEVRPEKGAAKIDPPEVAVTEPTVPVAPQPTLEVALETLDRHCSDGEYNRCEEDAKLLLEKAASNAPVATRVEVLRLRAIALVALGQVEESKSVFRTLLKLDPAYDLDLYRTSPKILDVFQAVAER